MVGEGSLFWASMHILLLPPHPYKRLFFFFSLNEQIGKSSYFAYFSNSRERTFANIVLASRTHNSCESFPAPTVKKEMATVLVDKLQCF